MDSLCESTDLARSPDLSREETRSRELLARANLPERRTRHASETGTSDCTDQEGSSVTSERAPHRSVAMTPTVAVGAFVFDREGRVLLVQRGRAPAEGKWSVPGGKLHATETLAQAVAREVREETGLVVEVGTLACVVERMSEDHHYVILDYLARVIGGELEAGDDARAAKFVDEGELNELPLTEGLMPLIARARAAFRAWR
jgi:8-oxo-dGTP diphosphatase